MQLNDTFIFADEQDLNIRIAPDLESDFLVYLKRSGNKAAGSQVLHLIPDPLKLPIS